MLGSALRTKIAEIQDNLKIGLIRSLIIGVDVGGMPAQLHEKAEFLRESSGSTNIESTLLKAVKVLALFHIPHYVCGGFAVQEHGYPRLTVDVDVIVPDVEIARDKLCMNGFTENPGSRMAVTDRETRVEVDLRPGGKKVDPGPLTFPMPKHVSETPQILTLDKLISSKPSTFIGVGIRRAPRLRRCGEVDRGQSSATGIWDRSGSSGRIP
jgi:hypothetical protein